MSDLIISVSGLRGVVGKSLTREVAARYAQAFSAELPLDPRGESDGREKGPRFSDELLIARSPASARGAQRGA